MGIGVHRRGLLEVESIEGVERSTGIALAKQRQQEVVLASNGSGFTVALGLMAVARGPG